MRITFFLSALTAILLSGCQTTAPRGNTPPASQQPARAAESIQREIRVGMFQADVARIMGSPNVITRVGNTEESWIFDKFKEGASFSKDQGGYISLLIGTGSDSSSESQQTSPSAKELTVIIYFHRGRVYDFTYHTSPF